MNFSILDKLLLINKICKKILLFCLMIAIIAIDCYILKNTLLNNFGYQFMESEGNIYVRENIYSDKFIIEQWIKKDNKWYYVEKNSSILKNGIYEIDGKNYYFDEDGKLIVNKNNFKIDNEIYNIDKNGVISLAKNNDDKFNTLGNVCLMGDSNFSKEKYKGDVTFFYENIDKNKFVNISESGAGFCSGLYDEGKKEYTSKPYYIMVEFIPKITDTLLIFSSFNDVNGNYKIGDLSDNEIGTICGSFNYTIKRALEINPKMKIIVFSPFKWIKLENNNDKKKNCEKYVDTILKLCKTKNITFYDLYHKSIDELNDEDYENDKIHISASAHSKIAKKIVIEYIKGASNMK